MYLPYILKIPILNIQSVLKVTPKNHSIVDKMAPDHSMRLNKVKSFP